MNTPEIASSGSRGFPLRAIKRNRSCRPKAGSDCVTKEARTEKLLDRLVRTELEQFVHYLASPWRIMWANFLAGTARGLGFILGVGVVLTGVGFLLTKVLGQIPIVGDFFSAINVWIQETIKS